MRIPRLKLYSSLMTHSARLSEVRPIVAVAGKSYQTREMSYSQKFEENGYRFMGLHTASSYTAYPTKNACLSKRSSRFGGNLGFQGSLAFAGINPLNNPRLFSSASEGNNSNSTSVPQATDVLLANSNGANIGGGSDDWIHKLKELWQSSVESAKDSSEKAKEAYDVLTPRVNQLFDAHPYLSDVIVPVFGTLAAWLLLPRLFRLLHRISTKGPGALLTANPLWGPVPYESSFWGALEAPVRYFATSMAILKIGQMVAPTVIAIDFTQACKGGFVVALVWFLYRWKTNVINRVLASKGTEGVRRDQLLTLDKISSVGLFVVGVMTLAEASGVAVQSILTVGGIGGVATAFASKDILGNFLTGLSVQISQPFSVGDTIKAGSVEGQVVEIGLTTTSLLTAEKFPVIVPNSMFSSQVIVNKSRAKFRSVVRKIPLQTDDIHKVVVISEDIKSMLRSNPNVFLGKEAPYCFLSQIERSYAELTLGCNLQNMNKDAEQDILLEAVRIVKQHGASLGSTRDGGLN